MRKKTILMIGATGLVGRTFLARIRGRELFEKVILLVRKEIPELSGDPLFEQHLVNFDSLEKYAGLFRCDVVISTLGSTAKKAGSPGRFREIDLGYPLETARLARKAGAETMILISSVGADPGSRSGYLKVKGELEESLKNLGFDGLHVLRPSLLIGDRQEFRFAERVGMKCSRLVSWMLPWRIRPVDVEVLAGKMQRIAVSPEKGFHVYEGSRLY